MRGSVADSDGRVRGRWPCRYKSSSPRVVFVDQVTLVLQVFGLPTINMLTDDELVYQTDNFNACRDINGKKDFYHEPDPYGKIQRREIAELREYVKMLRS